MLQIVVGNAENGKRLDRFLFSAFPDIPGSAIFKAFKKKDVKINGRRAREDILVTEGDVVLVYLPPEAMAGLSQIGSGDDRDIPDNVKASGSPDHGETNVSDHGYHPPRDFAGIFSGALPAAMSPAAPMSPVIAYEDNALLIVVKPQGVVVQEASPVPGTGHGTASRLEAGFDDEVRRWWMADRPALPAGFPALCHRLDRNTGGLLMFAKSDEALRAAEQKMKSHQIKKHYQCIVTGIPNPPAAEVNAWLEKDASKGRVYIHETPKSSAVPICTRYRTLSSGNGISLLEVEIITGRTHQIRAQLARLGHPILGDSKYGSNAVNRRHHIYRQALWANRLDFTFHPVGPLSEVAGRTIEWKDIPWDVEIGVSRPDSMSRNHD
jgi:23S rRNA pseudouridine955/2504/2580 synthase